MGRNEARQAIEKLLDKHLKRVEKAKLIKSQGGNKYQQLEARLMDEETGKLISCPVIYAIQNLEKREDVADFYQGYFQEVKNNLSEYKLTSEEEAKRFVLNDIELVLNLHFMEPKTHKLWNPNTKYQLK